jgi:hypothetical protein
MPIFAPELHEFGMAAEGQINAFSYEGYQRANPRQEILFVS